MASIYICDGCGSNVDKPKTVGHVLKRDYCAECAKNAEAFIASEEDERARLYARFTENRKHLIALHGKDGKFKLPDVP